MTLDDLEISVSEVVNLMRINGSFEPHLREAAIRKITASAAREAGIEVTDEELQQAADLFRSARKLLSAEHTEKWLKANGLSVDDLETYLETNLLIEKYKDILEKEADKEKYLSSTEIQMKVRDMSYRDWLRKRLG